MMAEEAAPGAARPAGCDRCGGPAAYTRRYSGQSLCAGCFSDSIHRKAAAAISRHGMIERGDLVCVAVSGGKDSLALLRVLSRMAGPRGFRIEAATIDEGIPGYRDEALGIAGSYCAGLGVPHRTYSYADLFGVTLDEALQLRGGGGATSCSICGTLRRRALDRAAADIGADSVATAHNLDDALQTFLINMISGDAARIGWMDPDSPSSGPRRIKPFCEIYEQEIVFYAFSNGIPFQAEPCPHAGEGIRTELREFLNGLEARHSGAKNSLYRSAVRVSQAMRPSSAKARAPCPRCGSECTGRICAACETVMGLKGARSGAPAPRPGPAAP